LVGHFYLSFASSSLTIPYFSDKIFQLRKGVKTKMKKLILAAIALCCISSLAYAQEAPVTTPAATTVKEVVTLKGDVIDNQCATANKADLANFVKTHTKQCALMPTCAASGYSIFSDGKLYAFDKESSAKVEEFLKKDDSKLQVVVTANKSGDNLSLVSIANQE